VSKPPGLLRFERLRIMFWIHLVRLKHGGEESEIDAELYEALGIVFPPDRRVPKATELFGGGHAPRISLRGQTVHDYVKAASRMLGNDAAEKMFYSNIWLTVLPRKRTMVAVVKAIRHVLRCNQLWRMPERNVIELMKWRHLCDSSPSFATASFVRYFSASQLRDLVRQGLMLQEDWSILMVLLHQEAFVSCQEEEANRLRAQASVHAIATVRKFFHEAPAELRAEVRGFEKALFYPPAKIADGPKEVIRSSRYVGSLVLPHLRDDRGRVIRRPSHHQIWTALQRTGPRGSIGGTG
jgi:hypothetical protein